MSVFPGKLRAHTQRGFHGDFRVLVFTVYSCDRFPLGFVSVVATLARHLTVISSLV